jgi:IclR family acetate operon transcriptional repressor
MPTPRNNSVIKAFHILRAFDGARSTLSTLEVAELIGGSPARAHRFLLTLEELGAIVRVQGRKYRLGMLMSEIGGRVAVHDILVEKVQPHVDALVEVLGETVHVAVLDGTEALYVAKKESERSMKLMTHVGCRLPVYCTAVGKALLSGLNDRQLDHYMEKVELISRTPKTVRSISALRNAVRQIRAEGYSIDNEEFEIGLRGVAVPISAGSKMCAAISVSGPTPRLGGETFVEMRNLLLAHASRIQRQLTGSREYHNPS